MSILSVINTTSTLFITILLGFLCGKIKLFKPEQDRVLINYVFYIALPLNLFLSCYDAKWAVLNSRYLLSYVLSMIVMIALSYFLSRKILKLKQTTCIVSTLSTSQVDGAYFTIPLFLLIFKSSLLAVPLMLIQNTVFFTLSLVLLQISCGNDKPQSHYWRFAIHQLVTVLTRNPIIVLSLLGILAGILSLKIPNNLRHAAEFMGSSASAVALFSLGLTCAFHVDSLSHKDRLYPLFGLSLLKLLILPLAGLMIGKMFHLEHHLLLALVLLLASPAATHTYIIAKKYETDVEIATFNVVLTTMLSFLTVNLWLYWLF